MGTNSTGCTEWERDYDQTTEQPGTKEKELMEMVEMEQFYFGSPDLDAKLLPAANEIVNKLRQAVQGVGDSDVKSNRAMIACYVLAAVNDDASSDRDSEIRFMELVMMTISIYRSILARKKGRH